MVFPILGGNGAVANYQIDNSLRFNTNDSAFLKRTNSTTGNRQKWTFSTWVKYTLKNNNSVLIYPHGASNNLVNLAFGADTIYMDIGSVGRMFQTNAVYRDPSAWYHVVVAFNTTDYATVAAGQVRVYVNGVEQTFSTTTNMSQGFNSAMNDAVDVGIGRDEGADNNYADYYLAETHLIDGQQLSPTDFGEFDEDSGIWKPIEYTGTYGTNGFYLDFENSGSLGADQSGNGNNFTPTNLASTDQTIDTPTNNFPTINVLQNYNSQLISEGNTKFITTNNSSTHKQIGTTFGVNTGKWYWEVKGAVDGNSAIVGISSESVLNNPSNLTTGDGHVGDDPESWGYISTTGSKVNNNSSSSYGNNWHTEIIGVALDLDNAKLYFSKSGVWQNSGDPESGSSGTGAISITSGLLYFPVTSGYDNGHGVLFNFGQDSSFAGNTTRQNNSDGNDFGDFYYAPPSGYLALCTQNLATELSPTIDDGSEYFNTVLWTGNNSNPRTITGVGFQSDFAWTKCRTNGSHHKLYDSSRGLNIANTLNSSGSDAEYSSTNGGVSGSDSDGFIVNAGSSNDDAVNDSAFTYVAWNWKANAGSTSSNTDGDITTTVQANTTAGFSIATFTGNGLNAQTIGHGLSQPTELYIWKRRDSAGNWGVETTVIDGTADFLTLNSTDAKVNSGTAGQYLPTSTTQYISFAGAGLNSNGGTYVCYSFHSVEGFSKIGKYTGNANTDGTFVYTGFRPSFVLTKRTDINGYSWGMVDSKRSPYNQANEHLFANASDAEYTTLDKKDLLSNGFKHRTNLYGNLSGGTYIYMAFAENPFVTSTGIPVTAR
jgi:hypothetical protein